MTVTFKNSTISLLIIIALGLSAWSILISRHFSNTTTNTIKNRPDVLMEDVVATIIDKEGKPSLKVSAPKMTHYTENDATEMLAPSVTVFRKESPKPWQINANLAKATHGISQIIFQDNVVILHPADKNNPLTTMRTNSLTVFPDKQVAQTAESILITQPASTIHAIGMLANLDDGTVKLLSEAKEEYVPNS